MSSKWQQTRVNDDIKSIEYTVLIYLSWKSELFYKSKYKTGDEVVGEVLKKTEEV